MHTVQSRRKVFHNPSASSVVSTLHKPQWNDPRILVSILIMVITMSAGYWAWNSFGSTRQLYMLTRDLAPGEALVQGDSLTLVDSHPGTPEGTYVDRDALPNGAIAARALARGELLPTTAIATTQTLEHKAVVLSISAPLPSSMRVGSDVDVWQLPDPTAARPSNANSSITAHPVAHHVIVSSIAKEQNSMISGGGSSVEVLVHDDDLPQILTALGQRGDLIIVPTGIQP